MRNSHYNYFLADILGKIENWKNPSVLPPAANHVADISPTSTPAQCLSQPAQVSKPYRILIMGDSFINGGVGVELERALLRCQELEVWRVSKPSTGLSRPDYFDWNQYAGELIGKYNPNIVFAMYGANDAQGLPMPEHKDIYYGTPAWDQEYGKRTREFMSNFANKNIKVYWLGNPIARESLYRQKMEKLNSIYQTQAKDFANMEYVATWDWLKNQNGEYSDFLPDASGREHWARESDGIHVSSFGGQIMMQKLMPKIVQDLQLTCQ